MPRITTFMYSEGSLYEQVPNGQRLHLVEPLITFTPMFIPGTMSFSITVGVLDVEIEKEHTLQLIFTSPKNNEQPLVDTGVVPIPRNVNSSLYDLPQEMRGLLMNFGFQNVVFRSEGIYKTTILFDGENLGEYPIQVKGKENLT